MNVPVAGDTICARATAAGRAGVTVIRLSGPAVAGYRRLHWPAKVPAHRGRRRCARSATREGEPIDVGLLLYFPAPASFTGEARARAARPRRARRSGDAARTGAGTRCAPGCNRANFRSAPFLNDKLDLGQAEAIADLIDSQSRAAARAAQRSLRGRFSELILGLNDQLTQLRVYVEAALDFPEEDIDFLDDTALGQRLAMVGEAFDSGRAESAPGGSASRRRARGAGRPAERGQVQRPECAWPVTTRPS